MHAHSELVCGSVYFVQSAPGSPIKIGYTIGLELRLEALQTGNPQRLRLLHALRPATPALERRIHRLFSEDRLVGEWFTCTPRLKAFIRATQKAKSIGGALAGWDIRSFAELVLNYLEANPINDAEKARLHRILRALGDVAADAVDQLAVERLCRILLRPGATSATVTRSIVGPLRAVLYHGARLNWCDPPSLKVPDQFGYSGHAPVTQISPYEHISI